MPIAFQIIIHTKLIENTLIVEFFHSLNQKRERNNEKKEEKKTEFQNTNFGCSYYLRVYVTELISYYFSQSNIYLNM